MLGEAMLCYYVYCTTSVLILFFFSPLYEEHACMRRILVVVFSVTADRLSERRRGVGVLVFLDPNWWL